MIKTFILWTLFSLVIASATPEPFKSNGIETYSEAKKWVESNYKGETVKPWFTTNLHTMTYYKEGRFMVIHFKSNKPKGYLYHNVSPSLWGDFKKARNKDEFYQSRIKGNKSIYLKLEK